MGKLYAGIDLHNNNYLCIIDESDKRLREVKLENNLRAVLLALSLYKKDLVGTVVESTFNWYWLETGSGLQVCKNGYSLNFNLFQFAKMSRKTRLYDPGTLYHVILRGNGCQRIFFDDSDFRCFYQSSIGNLQQSGKWQMLSIEMNLLSVVACIS